MKTALKNVLLAASLAALTVSVVAQEASGAADSKASAHKPTPQQHKKLPQKRIAHRTTSGKRTAGEAANLERQEAGLNAEERDMREDNRGRLTSASRAQHHPSHVSKAINQHKHSPTVATAHARNAAPVHTRQHRAPELKTGQLTPGQAAHLETKEASLHHQIHSDREQDGKPAPEDQAQTSAQQNKTTNQIHLKKHNARMF